MSKVLTGPLTDISVWVGFCTSIPQQGVKFQIRYWGLGPINSFCAIPNGNVFAHLGFKSKVLHGSLADLSA
jgi:hypothetical protein